MKIKDIPLIDDWGLTESHLKSFIPRFNGSELSGILFVGVGEKTGLAEALKPRYRVLCCDVIEAPNPRLPWLSADVRELDYHDLVDVQKYKNLVAQKLCVGFPSDLVFNCLNQDLWDGFDRIALKFCDNFEHYEDGVNGSLDNFKKCIGVLKSKGYKTINVRGDDYGVNLMIFASRKEYPRVSFYKENLATQCGTGIPTGLCWGSWDGNFYD